MRRDRLDSSLDQTFTRKLTSREFLQAQLETAKQTSTTFDRERLSKQIQSLTLRRQRVLDSYFEGVISMAERDSRLMSIQRDLKVFEEMLRRESPPDFDVDRLAAIFRAFHSFDELQRDQKRRLLNAITPEIEVKDYWIKGISLGVCERRSYTASPANDRIYLQLNLAA